MSTFLNPVLFFGVQGTKVYKKVRLIPYFFSEFDSVHQIDKPMVIALLSQYFSHDGLPFFPRNFNKSSFLIKEIRALVIKIISLV